MYSGVQKVPKGTPDLPMLDLPTYLLACPPAHDGGCIASTNVLGFQTVALFDCCSRLCRRKGRLRDNLGKRKVSRHIQRRMRRRTSSHPAEACRRPDRPLTKKASTAVKRCRRTSYVINGSDTDTNMTIRVRTTVTSAAQVLLEWSMHRVFRCFVWGISLLRSPPYT